MPDPAPPEARDAGAAGPRPTVPRTLLVTNDFPPRVGGVQQYEWNAVRHLPPERVSVLAPNWPGWRAHDEAQAFPVHRWPARFMWPTRDLTRRIRSLVREHDADVVLFGQGLPLPLVGPDLSRSGIPYAVLTHGVELWMARLPGTRSLLRAALSRARAITAISRATATALAPALPPDLRVSLLPPAVDERRFHPRVDPTPVRARHGLGGRRVVLCVSRLVERKGQDVLILGLDQVRGRAPDAVLLLVGDGPDRPRLEALAAAAPDAVVFAGEVPEEELPAYYAACDVFAMPCRSRWGGLEVEGFGIVYLEAAASGRPSVAGRSGGADEAVVDGETGILVEGAEPKAVALAVSSLLTRPSTASTMGAAGRRRVEEGFTWARRAEQLGAILAEAAG